MIRELYQRLSLRYQILKTRLKIIALEREEFYAETDIFELGLTPYTSTTNAYAHSDAITTLRNRKNRLIGHKENLESQLSTLKK